MIRMRKLGKDGFTLTEMLVATAVASLMIILIMTFLVNTLATNAVDTARADLLREAQLALDAMNKDIRLSANSDSINRWEDPHSPDADATNGFGWTSDESTLILATAALDSSRDVIFSDATHYITFKDNVIYYLDDGALYRRTLAGDIENNSARTSCPEFAATSACPADRRLVNNVSGFTVRYLNGDGEEVDPDQARLIEARLQLSATKYGRDITADYETRMVFRNE